MDFNKQYNEKRIANGLLYNLVFTLAGHETVLEPEHLAACRLLWRQPIHQPWLAAALLRRCEPGSDAPDDATVRFVARQLAEDLKMQPTPDIAELGELIPTFLLMFSDEAWHSPATLWNELLRVGKDQMTAATTEPERREPPDSNADTSRLASLFADSIGQPWTTDLGPRVDDLIGRYRWLAALRDAANVDLVLRRLPGGSEQHDQPSV